MPISEVHPYISFNMSTEAVKKCTLEQLIKRNVREKKSICFCCEEKKNLFSITYILHRVYLRQSISVLKYTTLVNQTQVVYISVSWHCFSSQHSPSLCIVQNVSSSSNCQCMTFPTQSSHMGLSNHDISPIPKQNYYVHFLY